MDLPCDGGGRYIPPAVPVSIGRLTNSRGSVICPVRALAATVSGLARYTALLVLPIRPGKLRLVVLTHVSDPFSRPNVSAGPPRQALHPLGPTRHPASSSTSSMLFSFASFSTPRRFSRFMSAWTSVLPGTTNVFTLTVFPLRMLAAKIMSVILPPVHEPM